VFKKKNKKNKKKKKASTKPFIDGIREGSSLFSPDAMLYLLPPPPPHAPFSSPRAALY
jgi:hypothetical protein